MRAAAATRAGSGVGGVTLVGGHSGGSARRRQKTAAAWLARVLGTAQGRVAYVESIARVYRLSLSGKGRGAYEA